MALLYWDGATAKLSDDAATGTISGVVPSHIATVCRYDSVGSAGYRAVGLYIDATTSSLHKIDLSTGSTAVVNDTHDWVGFGWIGTYDAGVQRSDGKFYDFTITISGSSFVDTFAESDDLGASVVMPIVGGNGGITSTGKLRLWVDDDYYTLSTLTQTWVSAVNAQIDDYTYVAVADDGKLYSVDASVPSATQIGSATNWAFCALGENGAPSVVNSAGVVYDDPAGTPTAYTGTYSAVVGTSPVNFGSANDAKVSYWDASGGLYYVDGTTVYAAVTVTGTTLASSNMLHIGVAQSHEPALLYGATLGDAPKATAPISIEIIPRTGSASAPISVGITGTGSASAPVRVAIIDGLETSTWSAVVTLGGVDVSAKLVGILDVDAEAGAARVASFTIRPAAGVVSPLAWVGASVTIDLVRVISGAEVPSRLFTGVVDVASFDPTTSLVRFACTDDLQNRVAALSKANIDTLTTGARYHAGAQGEIDEHWDYAMARMETLPASLDSGPNGNLRVTPWDGLTTWATFTESDILDQSLSIDLPRRSELINRVDVAYQYRYYRCRERRASLSWSKSAFGTAALAGGYQYPTQETIESALDGLGWERLAASFSPAPTQVAVVSPSGWYVECSGVSNMSASLGQRHAQTVTEDYTLSVMAQDSIALHGELARPLRGALASQWTPNEWEDDWTVTTPDASAGDVSYAGDETRAESDACVLTLLAMARVQILSAHRKTRMGFAIPCLPELDLVHAVEVDTTALAATGKVDRVQHTLNIDTGEATTRATLALSGVELSGTVSPATLAAPAAQDVDAATGTDDWVASLPNLSNHLGAATISTAYSDSMMGYIYNAPASITITDGTDTTTGTTGYYDEAEEYPTTGFRIAMPGVADTHRNPLEIAASAEYDIEIPRDTLTQTVS